MQALIAKRIRGTVLPVHAQTDWLVRTSRFGQNSTFATITLTKNSVLGGILVSAIITLPKTPKNPRLWAKWCRADDRKTSLVLQNLVEPARRTGV